MGRLGAAWLLGMALGTAPAGEAVLNRFEFSQVEMAVPMKIVLYAPDAATATNAAKAAFAKIHQLNGIMSDYDPQSELRRLCDSTTNRGPMPVSDDLWQVLCQAQDTSRRSEGAFDITVGPVVRLWRRARRQQEMPSLESLESARQLVGYQLIRLHPDQRAVELLRPGMRLDLGGIAKGYATDQALKVLREHGIDRALVEAGGDIGLSGPPPGEPGWRIGIARLEPNAPPSQVLCLSRTAIATSGDTWQYVEIDGRRYSHIVDPRTGLGLTDHSCVTVVAREGVLADALASAVSVLGPEKGLRLIEETEGTAAFIIRAPHGKLETYQSSRWKDLPLAAAAPASPQRQ